jgi:hypothetical protein
MTLIASFLFLLKCVLILVCFLVSIFGIILIEPILKNASYKSSLSYVLFVIIWLTLMIWAGSNGYPMKMF